MPKATKPEPAVKPDWVAIELDFRSGIYSSREIAKRHGLKSHAYISRKAKSLGWVRLDKEVRAKARHDLLVANSPVDATDDEIIETAAKIQVGVVQTHRQTIGDLRAIANRLQSHLVGHLTDLEATTIDQEGKKVPADITKLGQCTHVFEGLARAYGKLVPLERQAFSIQERGGDAPTDSMPLEERLAHYEREDTIEATANVVALPAPKK